MLSRFAFASLLGLGAIASSGASAADAAHPVVVELFESQGCNSCPPAIANLARMRDRSDVIALTFSVTYWDYLGWKDTFGQAAFTERQRAYAHSVGGGGPYTPQVVVNGRAEGVGADPGEIERLIGRGDRGAAGPSVHVGGGQVEIGAGNAPGAGADVWVVHYRPGLIPVVIARGENAGKTISHPNVVTGVVRIGHWAGAATSLALPAAQPGLGTAVLVQTTGTGAILAAGRS